MNRLYFVGKNIKKYRLLSGYSQEFLSEKVNLSREYISYVEQGHKQISLKKLFAIADVLGVKCSDLFDFY